MEQDPPVEQAKPIENEVGYHAMVAEGGSKRVYWQDEAGKKIQVKTDDVLESFDHMDGSNKPYSLQDRKDYDAQNADLKAEWEAKQPGKQEVAEISKGLEAKVAELEKRLEELLKNVEKIAPSQAGGEKTLDQKSDERIEEFFKKWEERLQRLEERIAGTKPAENKSGQKDDKKPVDGSEAPTLIIGKEIGDKVGAPGRAEINLQDEKGNPIKFRRDPDGKWQKTHNGNQASEWFPAKEEEVLKALGFAGAASKSSEKVAKDSREGEYIDGDDAYYTYKFSVGDEVAIDVPNQDTQTMAEKKGKIKGFEDKNGKIYAVLELEDGTSLPIELEQLARIDAKKNGVDEEDDDEFKKAMEDTPGGPDIGEQPADRKKRLFGWFRKAPKKAQEAYTNGRIKITNAQAGIKEEKRVENRRKRRFWGVLGALGLVGAGVGIGYLIWGRHGMEAPPGIGHGHAPKNEHVDFFNPALGHRRTGVELPPGLQPGHDSAGHIIIVDNHDHTVLGHSDLPKGIADGQNKLSKAARKALEAKDYHIAQHQIQQPNGEYSYMSEVLPH